MRYFITALFFVLCFTSTKAQNLLISTDYGNCGMGLKDSSGKWVLQPHYDNIKRSYGFYIVEQGERSGLVNRYGEIVIPVIYDDIQSEEIKDNFIDEEGYSTKRLTAIYFRVTKNKKIGLLDTTNKVIVPLEYDFLKINSDNTFLVRQGKKHWGVFHADGSFHDLHLYQKRFPGYKGQGLYSSSRITVRKLFHPFKYSSSGNLKYGLVDENGKVILKKKYKRIGLVEKNTDLIVATTKRNKIYYRQNGEEVFRFDNTKTDGIYSEFSSYNTSSTTINKYGYEIVSQKGRYGIVTQAGDTMLPLKYQYITHYFLNNPSKTQDICRVEQDSLSGLYDPVKRKWVLQPEYNSIYVIRSFYNKSDSSLVSLFRVEKNGKYSIISSTGEEILPYSIDSYSREGNEVFFRTGNTNWQLSFPGYNNSISTTGKKSNESQPLVNEIPGSGKFTQVTLKDGTLLYINPDLRNDSAHLSYYQFYTSTNTLDSLIHMTAFLLKKTEVTETISPQTNYYRIPSFIFTRDSIFPETQYITQQYEPNGYIYTRRISESWKDKNYTYFKCGNEYIRSDGFSVLKNYSLVRDKKTIFDDEGNLFIAICTRSYYWGLVDNNGKLVIDTVWSEIQYAGDQYYSVKKYEQYKRRKKYPDQYHYYNIVDKQTGKTLLPDGYHSSMEVITGYHSALVVRNASGMGIYNFDKGGYVLEPKFNRIEKLDSTGKYYVVKTCSGKIGIVSWEGKWLADTSWTAMINASYDRNYADQYGNSYSGNKVRQMVVLSDKGKWLIVNTANGTVSNNPADRDSILSRTFDNYKLVERKYLNSTHAKTTSVNWNRRCWNCPTVDTSKSTIDFHSLSGWQREILFDSLFAYQTFYYDTTYHRYSTISNCFCPEFKQGKKIELYSFQREYASSTMKHKISFANENCISVTRIGGFQQKHFTVIRFADGPHSMLLDSLFTGTQWKSFLITEIMNYLNSHPGINGNCSNPAALPFILKNNFEIKADGINFFMAGYYEKGYSLEILIPWEKLKPYMRTDVMEKIAGK